MKKMPVLWEFFAEVQVPDAVRMQDLHWLLSTWLDITPDGIAPAGRALAHRNLPHPKAWSLKAVLPHPNDVRVQVGLLEDLDEVGRSSLTEALITGIRTTLDGSRSGRLGRGGTFRTRSYPGRERTAEMHVVTAASWHELTQEPAARRWRLESTTTMSRPGQHFVPFPLPALIFDGLTARWQTWSNVPLPDPAPDAATGIATVDMNIARSTTAGVLGFTGCVAQEQTPAGPGRGGGYHPHTVAPLARLAEYCGVGVSTASGLGTTRYLPQ